MHAFQCFQHEFGRHLRDPRRAPRPTGVPARRAGIYAELMFNNLTGFLDACYPVMRAVLGERRWRRLQRAFFREARCSTPWFREIPHEFLAWLPADAGPAWLGELARHEWVELALDVMDVAPSAHHPDGDLLAGIPVLAPALMNLAYAWPVQRIGPHYRPRKPKPTHLLAFRDAGDVVRFVELTPVSARLVALLAGGVLSGRAACLRVAREIEHPVPDAVVAHGAALLDELRAAGAILGTRP